MTTPVTTDEYIEQPLDPQSTLLQQVSSLAEDARYSGIREVLVRWGNWAREQPHIGYPRKSAGMGQNPSEGKFSACSDDEGRIIDRAVLALQSADGEAYRTILSKYVVGASGQQAADYLGMNKRRYFEVVAAAELALAVALLTTTALFPA